MAVLRIKGFSGRVPMMGDRALQDNFAVDAMNTWLYGSELRGVRPPVVITTVNPGIQKVLRVPKRLPDSPPPSDVNDGFWVGFQDPDTDIVKGQLVEDQYERWYFCSPTEGPKFNTYQRMQTGLEPYKLGVIGPDTTLDSAQNNAWKPVVGAPTGGSEPVETRAYLYTWVNEFGEESTPSLPGSYSGGNSNGIWPVSNIRDPPAPPADYPAYTKKYLYRTVTGASGQTTYYRVTELPMGTTTFNDDGSKLTNAIIVGNLQLESTNWNPPPNDPVLGPCLRGWVAMPNGFLIGFDKNNIYMSEAYHWHAWPAEYKQATETPIVGLGIIGQTCVVCTEGYPTTVTGSQPATCSFTKVTTGEPCLSRGSIVSTPDGVIHASQNGLVMIGPGGVANVTKDLITRDDWLKQYRPETARAVRYQNGYLAMHDREKTSTLPGKAGFLLDPTALKVALTEFTDFSTFINLNVDTWSGEVLVLRPGADSVTEVLHWDPPTTDTMPVRWLSKEFQYEFKENFGAYAIYWDDKRLPNPPVNWGNALIPQDQKVRFRVYADRKIVYDQPVPKNGGGVRLPSGFKADIWQFEIRSRAPVYSLHVASTMKELKSA